jgi:plasmid stabilization system protein ParE
MAKKIIWTPEAEKTFSQVIDYLEANWTKKEIKNFVIQTNTIAQLLSEFPHLGRYSFEKDSREVLITKHNILIYKEYGDRIDLIVFFDTRQDPIKKPKAK